MLEFFKINDPFRMIGILILFILLQTPYYLMEIPTLQPEFIWKLLGQQINSGDIPYVAIIDNTGPLSAMVYWFNDILFSNSWLSFRMIASAIIFFQVFYTNHMFIENNAYDESNYLPAFFMLLLYQLSFDFLTLSPALMGSTFVGPFKIIKSNLSQYKHRTFCPTYGDICGNCLLFSFSLPIIFTPINFFRITYKWIFLSTTRTYSDSIFITYSLLCLVFLLA